MGIMWKPTELDIAWMKALFTRLSVGGIWSYSTSPIIFRKEDKHTFALIRVDMTFPDVAEQIERNRTVMEKAGIKFVDKRFEHGI